MPRSRPRVRAPSIALVQQKRTSGKDVLFSLKEPHPGLKVRASSFHCGRRRAGVHRTPCAVYRFCSTKKDIRTGCPFSLKEPHPGLKVRASLFHCGRRRAGVHRTPCAVYRFCSTKRTFGKDYDKEYSSFIIFVNDMKKTILGLIKKLFNNIILRQK